MTRAAPQKNAAEGTKSTWLAWKVTTESGEGRVGSVVKGRNDRLSPDRLDSRLLCRSLGGLNEVGAFSGVGKETVICRYDRNS